MTAPANMISNSSSSSGSSVASVVSTTSAVPASTSLKTWTTDPRDSCRWYSGLPCERPRTCFDCLNVQLPGADCAVDAGGGCVPIYQYEAMLRTPGYNESALAYYPSNNYTYCATIDATCASCRATWMESSSVAKGAASSCTGAGGCVCVAYCEMPEWSKIVLERNLCPSFVSTITTSKEVAYYKLLIALGIGIGLCAVFTVIALGVRYLVRILEARTELARLNRRRRPRREPSGPQLRLSGWKAMLDDLIESERVQLGGDARAPVLTAEAPTVLVEEGDGYRPMSPSTPHDRE